MKLSAMSTYEFLYTCKFSQKAVKMTFSFLLTLLFHPNEFMCIKIFRIGSITFIKKIEFEFKRVWSKILIFIITRSYLQNLTKRFEMWIFLLRKSMYTLGLCLHTFVCLPHHDPNFQLQFGSMLRRGVPLLRSVIRPFASKKDPSTPKAAKTTKSSTKTTTKVTSAKKDGKYLSVVPTLSLVSIRKYFVIRINTHKIA